MMKKLKIENLSEDWQTKVLRMKGEGMSNQSIAEILNKEAEYPDLFNSGDVFNFINKYQDKAIKLMKDRGKFEKKMAEYAFSTVEQLNELNREMTQVFYEMRTNPQYKEKTFLCSKCNHPNKVSIEDINALTKIADHLLKQLQHVDQVLGKLTKKSLQITYNIQDINTKVSEVIPEAIDRMRREGRFTAIERLLKKERRKRKAMMVNYEQDLSDEDEDWEDEENVEEETVDDR